MIQDTLVVREANRTAYMFMNTVRMNEGTYIYGTCRIDKGDAGVLWATVDAL